MRLISWTHTRGSETQGKLGQHELKYIVLSPYTP
jgi:hypothetical protein